MLGVFVVGAVWFYFILKHRKSQNREDNNKEIKIIKRVVDPYYNEQQYQQQTKSESNQVRQTYSHLSRIPDLVSNKKKDTIRIDNDLPVFKKAIEKKNDINYFGLFDGNNASSLQKDVLLNITQVESQVQNQHVEKQIDSFSNSYNTLPLSKRKDHEQINNSDFNISSGNNVSIKNLSMEYIPKQVNILHKRKPKIEQQQSQSYQSSASVNRYLKKHKRITKRSNQNNKYTGKMLSYPEFLQQPIFGSNNSIVKVKEVEPVSEYYHNRLRKGAAKQNESKFEQGSSLDSTIPYIDGFKYNPYIVQDQVLDFYV